MSVVSNSPVSGALTDTHWWTTTRIDPKDRSNNFYLIRLMLAARVIFGHAFVLGGVAVESEEFTIGNLYNSLGVNGFFVISGFLVTNSLLSSGTLREYVAARVLRIVPALWVMLFVTVPVVVLCGSHGAYASGTTWASALDYLVRNMTIMLVTYPIDGVFENLPNTAVNGSIWMLRFEVVCYALLGLFGWFGIVRHRGFVALFAVTLILLFLVVGVSEMNFYAARMVRLGSLFFFGCAMVLFADRIAVNAWLGLIGVVAAAIVGYATKTYDVVYFAFGYLLICVAYSKAHPLRRLTTSIELRRFGKPDLSYGIFLYSFPIQQLLYTNHLTPGPISNIVATVVLASLCAYFSSELIEKPTARMRSLLVKPNPA